MEAYSTTVMGASALPSTRSGSGPGFINSSTGTSVGAGFLRCASAAGANSEAATTARAAMPIPSFSPVFRASRRLRLSPHELCGKSVTEWILALGPSLPTRQSPINIGSGANKANRRERLLCRSAVEFEQALGPHRRRRLGVSATRLDLGTKPCQGIAQARIGDLRHLRRQRVRDGAGG